MSHFVENRTEIPLACNDGATCRNDGAIRIHCSEVITRDLGGVFPDSNKLLLRLRLGLPAWKRCCYYAPFQRHAINPDLDLWPEGYNQCHPLPMHTAYQLHTAKTGGMFAVFELEDGRFLALLPLVAMQTAAWLHGGGDALWLEASHFGSRDECGRGTVPLLSVAIASDIYGACAQAWQQGLGHPLMRGVGQLRQNKTYPEVFEYLGWCSFEEFKLNINESVLVDALKSCAVSAVPVRWVLVDDGHVDDGSHLGDRALQTQEGKQMDGLSSGRCLHGAYPHPAKFPHGWEPVMRQAKADPRLRWMGLWLNHNGYWSGVAANHRMGEALDSRLVALGASPCSPKLPGEQEGDAYAFYDCLTTPARQAGFDFLKVDHQAANLYKYSGAEGITNAVNAAARNRQALDAIVGEHFSGIIGCMAHNNLCILHQPVAQVIRCSEDYKKEDLWRAKHHLHNSFGNMLWMGQTVWGDHDMFHSSDRVAAAVMARSKAVCGGPVYLSDHPADFVAELILPLCLASGRLLRTAAPAVPLPRSVFTDPYEDDEAFAVIAPLRHGCAVAAAYNLTSPEKPVHGSWQRSDLAHRNALLAGEPGDAASADTAGTATAGILSTVQNEGASERGSVSAGVSVGARVDGNGRPHGSESEPEVLLYDVIRREATLLCNEKPEEPFVIDSFGDRLVILSPVVRGWALIGSPQKYLTVEMVEHFSVSADGLRATVTAVEDGAVWLWQRGRGIVQCAAHAGVPVVVVAC